MTLVLYENYNTTGNLSTNTGGVLKSDWVDSFLNGNEATTS